MSLLSPSAQRVLRRFQPALRLLPLGIALSVSVRESQAYIHATSFKIGRHRYYSLFDDGMISMRYAWNLAHGHGLVWNRGERIEGFTNPLWVLVMTLAILVFSQTKAVLAIQVLGAALHAAAALVFARIGGSFFRASPWPLVALFEAGLFWLLADTFPLRFWSHMGMEVSALLMIAALGWRIALRRFRSPRAPLALGVLAAVAYLVRPDGFLVVTPPLFLCCLRISQAQRTGAPSARTGLSPGLSRALARSTWARLVRMRPMLLPAAAPLAAAAIVVVLSRLAYYGEWVPNTYRLKMGHFPLLFRLVNGWSFLQPYLAQVGILLVAGVIACILRRSWRTLALAAGPAVLFAYQVYVGGDPWPYWRQLTPGYPALLLLCAIAVAASIVRLRWRLRRRLPQVRLLRWAGPPAALVLIIGALEPTRAAFADNLHLRFNIEWNEKNVKRALMFRKILHRDGRAAVIWAGATPYYDIDRYAIDLLGKCDRTVAGMPPDLTGAAAGNGMQSIPGHNKSNLTHSLIELGADYSEQSAWGRDKLSPEDAVHFKWFKIDGEYWFLRRASPRIDWGEVRKATNPDAPEGTSDGGPPKAANVGDKRRVKTLPGR